MFEQQGKSWEAANSRIMVGRLLMYEGHADAARSVLRDALTAQVALRASISVVETVATLAALRVQTDAAGAARMLAGARAVFERERAVPDEALTAVLEETESSVRERLGDRFEDECAAGRALDEGELVELALDEPA